MCEILKALLPAALSLAVLPAGGYVMSRLTGREYSMRQLRERLDRRDAKPLNQRLAGYDLEAVRRHWGALDARALAIERRMLEVDLAFPLVYGAVFAAALLLAGAAAGWPHRPAWLLAPVLLGMAADWTENLTQLGQIRRFADGGGASLQPGRVRLASAATITKLASLGAAFALILLLTAIRVWVALS